MYVSSLHRAVISLTAVFALCGLVRAEGAEAVRIPALDRLIETHPVTNLYPKGVPAG